MKYEIHGELILSGPCDQNDQIEILPHPNWGNPCARYSGFALPGSCNRGGFVPMTSMVQLVSNRAPLTDRDTAGSVSPALAPLAVCEVTAPSSPAVSRSPNRGGDHIPWFNITGKCPAKLVGVPVFAEVNYRLAERKPYPGHSAKDS